MRITDASAYFWRKMKNGRWTIRTVIRYSSPYAMEGGRIAHQLFQVFAILPTQTSICLPHPIPARSMLPTRCKEHNSIIRLNCNQYHIRSEVLWSVGARVYRIGPDMKECAYGMELSKMLQNAETIHTWVTDRMRQAEDQAVQKHSRQPCSLGKFKHDIYDVLLHWPCPNQV